MIWILVFLFISTLSIYLTLRLSLKNAEKHFTTDINESIGLSVYRKYKMGHNKFIGTFYIKVYVPDETRGNRIIKIIEEEIDNMQAGSFEFNISEQNLLEIVHFLTNLKVKTIINQETGEIEKYEFIELEQFIEANDKLDDNGRIEGLMQQVNEDVSEIVSHIFNSLYSE